MEAAVASRFEAGRDGSWLHRLLSEHGVINHVVEPTMEADTLTKEREIYALE